MNIEQEQMLYATRADINELFVRVDQMPRIDYVNQVNYESQTRIDRVDQKCVALQEEIEILKEQMVLLRKAVQDSLLYQPEDILFGDII